MAWGRAVKRRQRRAGVPPLWFFTDATRVADPLAVIHRLPRGLCGVVCRDASPALARAMAQACRARGVMMALAGSHRLARALGVGAHLRRGRGVRTPGRFTTASAHSVAELRRAHRAGADLAFLSPVFATASHVGARGLGVVRWAAMAGRARLPVAALGGVDGARVRRLPRCCAGFGAIGAWL